MSIHAASAAIHWLQRLVRNSPCDCSEAFALVQAASMSSSRHDTPRFGLALIQTSGSAQSSSGRLSA
jgi:hypothetical protein